MPDTMTLTYDETGRNIHKIIADWESAGGVVTATTKKISGHLIKGFTNPDTGPPTNDYDIVISDEEGFNVLTNCDDDLIDRDTLAAEEVYFSVKDAAAAPQGIYPVVSDKLTFTLVNAGNSTGKLIVYWSPRKVY